MELELIKEKELPLLSRKRASFWYKESGATPSRKNLIKEIAKRFKANEDLVIIKHIYPQFGSSKAKVLVHIYDDKKKMDFFEHKALLKKHVFKEAAKAEPAAEKSEDKAEAVSE
ncbi:MAG: hypothetical protein KKF44_02040 [Nanoarchaeota archaeon]|nr:hypothetical protein [Nanoarchaeota archaeon]